MLFQGVTASYFFIHYQIKNTKYVFRLAHAWGGGGAKSSWKKGSKVRKTISKWLMANFYFSYLEKPGKDISGLASDNIQARVEFAKAGIQVLQTL